MSQTLGAQHPLYRRDIDGLRALAIASVVVFHAAPALLPSGFVGVDIFFVISGYLITGLIYRSVSEGRFSFLDFYARRARRILPALLLVAAVFSLLAIVCFNTREMLEFSGQTALALVGASNIYFWKHVDYFSTASDQEPMLMTWSLGVEEQFYIVFPLLLLAIARLPRRARIACVGGGTVLSFAASVHLTSSNPVFAFYMLPSRAWEMGLGAWLAIVCHETAIDRRLSKRWMDILSVVCALGLVSSVLVIDGRTPFPGWAALLPAISTLGLIFTRTGIVNERILSTSAFVGVGLISYSWYLWHWPMMALARRSADSPPSAMQMLGIAGLSAVLAVLSWHFVEQPFRTSRRAPRDTVRRYAGAVCCAGLLLLVFKVTGGLPGRLPEAVRIAERTQLEGRGTCLAPFGEAHLPKDPNCNPPAATVALLGDSHASAFGPGLVASAERSGVAVAQFSKSACPPLPGFAPVEAQHPLHGQECAVFVREAVDRIVGDPNLRIVFVAAAWPSVGHDATMLSSIDIDRPVQATDAMRRGLAALAAEFQQAGKRMVIVGDVPRLSFSPPDHVTGEALPARRVLGRLLDGQHRASDGLFMTRRDGYAFDEDRDFVRSVADDVGVTFFDPSLDICSGGSCRYASGPVPLYYDSHHLSAAGSRLIDWSSVLAGKPPESHALIQDVSKSALRSE